MIQCMWYYFFFLLLDSYGLYLVSRYVLLLVRKGYLLSRDTLLSLPAMGLFLWQLCRMLLVLSNGVPDEIRNLKLVGIENLYLGWYWITGATYAYHKIVARARQKFRQ